MQPYLYKIIFCLFLGITLIMHSGCNRVSMPEGKSIYVPLELQVQDLEDDDSEWSFHRMEATTNLVVFWQKGFGKDWSDVPSLNGQPMSIDMLRLKARLEYLYSFYRDTLDFHVEGSVADHTRMLVLLNYTLDGTVYGGSYDNTIGALWLAPSTLHDDRLNDIAHEFAHTFQAQVGIDRPDGPWNSKGFFEMASQWMVFQENPRWIVDEKYHLEAFKSQMHKSFLDGDYVYHSPYVLQYWSDLHGRDVIARLFKEAQNGEDPIMAYKRLYSLSQNELCDDMFEASRHFVGLDYRHAWNETRAVAGQVETPMVAESGGWLRPRLEYEPENYGFNVVPAPIHNGVVSVQFKGTASNDNADYRYGFVAVDELGSYHYSPVGSQKEGTLTWQMPFESKQAWLVVMGAPRVHWRVSAEHYKVLNHPYQIRWK